MAEKIRFFPIDVTYKIIDGKPVIHIFAKTTNDKHILILDDSFKPYFYVIPKNCNDAKKKIEKIRVEKDERVARVTRAEIVRKKYIGKEVEAIKVYTSLPRDIPIIRDIIKEWEVIEKIFEYDILFYRRYLIDRNITPLLLHEADVKPASAKAKVPTFMGNKIDNLGTESIRPRILAFDIETYNPDKNIQPDKNPIIMLAFHSDRFSKVFVWKKFKTDLPFVEFVDSEAELIERFKETIESFKPDILTGYYSDGFDLPYIKARAKKYKINLDIGLDYSDMRSSKGNIQNITLAGINHLDIFKFIRRVMRSSLDTDEYSLDAVASEMLGEKKEKVNLDNLSTVWDNKTKELEKFAKYNLTDAVLTYKLAIKSMPTIIEMVKIVGLTIQDISRMGFSQLVEWFLLKNAPGFNEIAPNKPKYNEIQERRTHSFQGAFVFEPKPGLYKNIVVFDYRSLYPTIIGSHNISPGTLNCKCCKDSAKKIPTEDRYWFCKKKRGFIPTLIEELITRRMRIKEIIKDTPKKEHSFLEARSNTLKLLANSFYGYLGFFGARWYCLECAKATTAWGRYYIHNVIDKAQEKGFKVLYSDTDSVFLALEEKTEQDAHNFVEKINSDLPGLMELEYEGFYPSGIFVSAKMSDYGAKKKYALLSEKNTLKIKGFETVRRNWSVIAKETQEKVLEIILKEHNKEKAMKYVKKIINNLRNKNIAIEKVIINTQLQKDLNDYAARGPHVAVAQKLKNKGIEVGPGTLIKFVITQGSDSISNRAKLPEEISQKDYDAEYYINNQVVPSVETIFKVLGYSKEDILEHKEQKKLEGFF